MSWLFWLFTLILLVAAAVAGLWAYRVYVIGDSGGLNLGGWLFRSRPEPRLGIMEQASVDSRRRLVLIRRDNVEHLIMTGGPVDVVIETGITTAPMERAAAAEPSASVFTRQPRTFGQAVNE